MVTSNLHTHTHFMAVKHIASEPSALHSSFLSFGLTKPITCHVRMFGSKIVQMTYPFAMGFDLSLPNVWNILDSLGYLEIARWTKYLSVFCLPSSSCRFFIHISFHKAPIRLLIEHCLIWFFLLPQRKIIFPQENCAIESHLLESLSSITNNNCDIIVCVYMSFR